jgi:signal transduction histidine kinase/integral membrane sensor domain MASE1
MTMVSAPREFGPTAIEASTAESWVGRPILFAALLLAAAYYAGAILGFAFTFSPLPVSVLWLPNAIVLGALLLAPTRSWWLLLVAVLPVHLAVEVRSGVPPGMVACWYVSNTLEAVLGAWLVRRRTGRPVRLDRYEHVAVFIVFAGLLAPVLSSFLDAGFVRLNDWGESGYWSVWRNRVLSNSLAVLTVVPVLLAWDRGVAGLGTWSRGRRAEAALLTTALLAVSLLAFGWPGTGRTPALMYAPLPLLLLAAVRFGPGGASAGVLVVVLLSTWSAVHGRGPFVQQPPSDSALNIQLLFLGLSITLLILAAVLEERRCALQSAKLRGEQQQLAMSAAQMGSWDCRVPHRSIDISAEARRILGIPAVGEVRTISQFLELIHREERPMASRAITRSMIAGDPLDIEFRLARANGHVRWVLCSGKAILDARGRPDRLIGLCADVTQRKADETLVAGQHRMLDMIASGAPLEMVLDRLVGLVESEREGLACSILLLEGDGFHVRHGCALGLPGDFVQRADASLVGHGPASDGRTVKRDRPVMTFDICEDPAWESRRALAAGLGLRYCWSSPVVAEQGPVLGWLAVYNQESRDPGPTELRLIDLATDIVALVLDRKRVEAEAHEQRRALAHLSRVVMLGELSGVLAHEIAQPLSAILSNTQAAQRLLLMEPPRLDDIGAILRDIVSDDQRAVQVIRHHQAMLKKDPVDASVLDLNEIATSSLELARVDLAVHGVRVDARLAPGLPGVLGDRVQLQQVILNLAINACDAMSTVAPVERRLSVETRHTPDGFVELCIGDQGTGISDEHRARIFEPFFTTKARGLGVGLAICRSIVVAHRGRLQARNNDGRGALFCLTLPAHPTARADGRQTH